MKKRDAESIHKDYDAELAGYDHKKDSLSDAVGLDKKLSAEIADKIKPEYLRQASQFIQELERVILSTKAPEGTHGWPVRYAILMGMRYMAFAIKFGGMET
jgi:hypothetical protein